MNIPTLATVLGELEDELFYGFLDVVLDIDQALTVQSAGPIVIGATRMAVRYQILCPNSSWDARLRYVDLRHKGLLLLAKQGLVGSLRFNEKGIASWDGQWVLDVADRARFARLLEELKAEQERRRQREKVVTEMADSTTRLLRLAESFHRVAVRLRTRPAGREPVLINDEYDVQYVFAALLKGEFEDVRSEEWMPKLCRRSHKSRFLSEERVSIGRDQDGA